MKNSHKVSSSRRRFIRNAGLAGGALAWGHSLPTWARTGADTDLTGIKTLSGNVFDLTVSESRRAIAGQAARSILVNEQLPAPLLRWREGDELTLRVTNKLMVDTSIHWHGILLPFHMDGVPGLSFPGIKPGETFTYKFSLSQAGTYWYHSHSGLQEQLGHYGPIIVEPAEPDPVQFDREFVVVLSDWTFEDPHRVFAKLKKMSDNYNFQQRTVGEFLDDVESEGVQRTIAERIMWGSMRMNPTDIADVTGATYTYLINGHAPADNWTGLYNSGERVRLRFINASAMSIFNVRIPDLPMQVVQADGLDVQPVETDELQIGVAETFDVVVQPSANRAHTIMAESNDRSGFARATLTPKMGLTAPTPALRPRPTLSMKDMAMDHSDHDMGAMHAAPEASVDMPTKAPMARDTSMSGHANQEMPADASMDHSAHTMHTTAKPDRPHDGAHADMMSAADDHDSKHNMHASEHAMHKAMGHATAPLQAHNHAKGPGVVGLAMRPTNRLAERPVGLEDVPHRVLVYTDLKSLLPNPDQRAPGREIELHLTSNMERYMWSFDGLKYSEVDSPILFHEGERARLTMVNDTMMPHPIHLHGMFFDVVTGDHVHKPRKHTIVIKPGEKMSVDITADAVGDWAFHCHLLYHMHAGMMRAVSIMPHGPHS